MRDLYPKALLCPAEYGEGVKDLADLYQEHEEAGRELLEDLKQRAVDALELEISEQSRRYPTELRASILTAAPRSGYCRCSYGLKTRASVRRRSGI